MSSGPGSAALSSSSDSRQSRRRTLDKAVVGRTTPMVSVGAGVLIRGGPIVFDAALSVQAAVCQRRHAGRARLRTAVADPSGAGGRRREILSVVMWRSVEERESCQPEPARTPPRGLEPLRGSSPKRFSIGGRLVTPVVSCEEGCRRSSRPHSPSRLDGDNCPDAYPRYRDGAGLLRHREWAFRNSAKA